MKLAILEDDPNRVKAFVKWFPDAFITENPNEFLRKLGEEHFDVLALDHDLSFYEDNGFYSPSEVTGYDVCKNLPASFTGPVIVHSWNASRAPWMVTECQARGLKSKWAMFPDNLPILKQLLKGDGT